VENQKVLGSLRLRLLLPIIATALLAAVAVAIASNSWGGIWAERELEDRYDAIRLTLKQANYPLNSVVLDSLAQLTRAELIGLDREKKTVYSTVQDDTGNLISIQDTTPGSVTRIRQETYRVFCFPMVRRPSRQDPVESVAVLFGESQIKASRRRALLLPMVTGLSTIIALTTITYVLASRLVTRIRRLQLHVESVASGDFKSRVSDEEFDELGRLGSAVDSMAGQLDQLWKQVNRQQSEKLLHQIASGMAHQLRNSLTGARMAVELHARDCRSRDEEAMEVAIHQIEVSEDYVRRLLLVASGRQDEDRALCLRDCFEDVKRSVSPIARHQKIDLHWTVAGNDLQPTFQVADGPTWIAAATNLVHNAMQAGNRVSVKLSLSESLSKLKISDNGPGISDAVAKDLFEPFVTSRPEGMGLGLSVVKRAAERLRGDVRWRRENDETIFEFDVPCRNAEDNRNAEGMGMSHE
jgi:signal transduction histidine kinase